MVKSETIKNSLLAFVFSVGVLADKDKRILCILWNILFIFTIFRVLTPNFSSIKVSNGKEICANVDFSIYKVF